MAGKQPIIDRKKNLYLAFKKSLVGRVQQAGIALLTLKKKCISFNNLCIYLLSISFWKLFGAMLQSALHE